MSRRYLYLIRHAQRETDAGGDPLGPRLTELGWKQAHQVARRLAGLKVDVIHTSSLRRAVETARIVAVEHPDVPIRPSRLLWECVPAMPRPALEWLVEHPETEAGGLPVDLLPWRGVWAGIENTRQLLTDFEQARQAWDKFFIPARGKERHDILVGHGNLIRYFVLRALQSPPEAWINMDIYNCSLSEIVIEPDGRPLLVSFNDSGHLHADQVTLF